MKQCAKSDEKKQASNDDTIVSDGNDSKNYVINSRSMEWAVDLHCKLVVQPKDDQFYYGKLLPNYGEKLVFLGENCLTKKNTYAYYYLSICGLSYMPFDGVNEKGLSMGSLYLPGFSHYLSFEKNIANQKDEKIKSQAISYSNLVHYILGNFESVDDVIKGLKENPVYIFDYDNILGLGWVEKMFNF